MYGSAFSPSTSTATLVSNSPEFGCKASPWSACRCAAGYTLAFALAPRQDEVGHAGVAVVVAAELHLGIQRLGRAPLVLRAPGVGLQRLLERVVENRELVWLLTAPILRWAIHFAVQSLGHRVRAIAENIEMMRTFVRVRALTATHGDLAKRLAEVEDKTETVAMNHDTFSRNTRTSSEKSSTPCANS